MTSNATSKANIIRTERGLTIAGTRITLYDVMDYVIAANNPTTLVGNAADGAYVVVGDRTLSR